MIEFIELGSVDPTKFARLACCINARGSKSCDVLGGEFEFGGLVFDAGRIGFLVPSRLHKSIYVLYVFFDVELVDCARDDNRLLPKFVEDASVCIQFRADGKLFRCGDGLVTDDAWVGDSILVLL